MLSLVFPVPVLSSRKGELVTQEVLSFLRTLMLLVLTSGDWSVLLESSFADLSSSFFIGVQTAPIDFYSDLLKYLNKVK